MHQHGDGTSEGGAELRRGGHHRALGRGRLHSAGREQLFVGVRVLNRNRGYEIGKDTVDAFGEGILRHIRGFKSMELSNLVWATSALKIQFEDREVMAAMDADDRRGARRTALLLVAVISNMPGPPVTTPRFSSRGSSASRRPLEVGRSRLRV